MATEKDDVLTPETIEEGVALTPQNVVKYQAWLGHLAAHAIIDHGVITFFTDEDGDVRAEIPDRTLVGTGRDYTGGD